MDTCFDCKRLWKEYADSMAAYIETVRQSQRNSVQQDSLALMKSEWLERAALRNRQKARKALTEHQVSHLIQELETGQGKKGASKSR
jgi:hypothetical protein